MNPDKSLYLKPYDKAEVILEIGLCFTKVGFQSDMLPRKILQTHSHIFPHIGNLLRQRNEVRPHDANRLIHDYYDFEVRIEEYLHFIFDQEVAMNLRERNMYLIYDYYKQDTIINSIAKVLYKKFEVARITFLVSNVLPIYLTGLYSGLVIDGGMLQTTMSAVYEGYSLLHLGGSIGNGGLDISINLLKEIIAENPNVTKQPAYMVTIQTAEWLEEVKVRIGRVLSLNASNKLKQDDQEFQDRLKATKISIPIFSGNNITLSYHAVATAFTNTLFGNYEEEQPNIAYNFLKMVRELHRIEVAQKVLKNVIFTGGLIMVPNFINRFKEELQYLLDKEFMDLKKVCQQIFVTQTQNNPQHLGWIAATVVSQTQLNEKLTLHYKHFKENGYMMTNRSDGFNMLAIQDAPRTIVGDQLDVFLK